MRKWAISVLRKMDGRTVNETKKQSNKNGVKLRVKSDLENGIGATQKKAIQLSNKNQYKPTHIT
jgi:hypothetical protein